MPGRTTSGCARLRDVEEPWEDPAWLATAIAWVDEQLAGAGRRRTGDVDQMHVRPWATVIRVPTAEGDGVLQGEHARAAARGRGRAACSPRRVPDRVPPLIADDIDRGWMLMEDGGRRLREVIAEERDLSRWDDIVEGAADVARAMEPDVDELLAAGVPDMRLAVLPDQYAALVDDERRRAAVPRRRPTGPRAGRGARVVRRDRDAAARRPPRRSGLRPRRPAADPRLGRRRHLAPVLHPVGHPRGRGRVGPRRRGERRRHRPAGRALPASLRPGAARAPRRRAARAPPRLGVPGHQRDRRRGPATRPGTVCGCSSTAGSEAQPARLMLAPQCGPIISHSLVVWPKAGRDCWSGACGARAWADGPTRIAASTSAPAAAEQGARHDGSWSSQCRPRRIPLGPYLCTIGAWKWPTSWASRLWWCPARSGDTRRARRLQRRTSRPRVPRRARTHRGWM